MTLDCPGCHSRLKLDPARLPPGASAAVCPKCRTRILLPGTADTAEISVQCAHCSARLKVKVAKLKPTAIKSRCPKCGGQVDLPAAPASPAGGRAARMPAADASKPSGRPSAPVRAGAGSAARREPAAAQAAQAAAESAKTRRMDAKEMAMLMSGHASAGSAGGPEPPAPISLGEPGAATRESSATDLSRLIDEKVDALGDAAPAPPAPRAGEPSVEDLPLEMPAVEEPPPEKPAPPPAIANLPEPPRSEHAPPRAKAAAPRKPAVESRAPTFSSVMPAERRADRSPGVLPTLLGGIVGGVIVWGALFLGRDYLPEGYAPPVLDVVSRIVGGDNFGLLALLILLAGLSGLLAGLATPPAGESGTRISVFRCTVAAGMVGLLAGVGISLIRGGGDLATIAMPTASWTIALVVAGLLTGAVAKIFAPR